MAHGGHTLIIAGGTEWGRRAWQGNRPSALPHHHLGPTHGRLLEARHGHACSHAVGSHQQMSPLPGAGGSADSTRESGSLYYFIC